MFAKDVGAKRAAINEFFSTRDPAAATRILSLYNVRWILTDVSWIPPQNSAVMKRFNNRTHALFASKIEPRLLLIYNHTEEKINMPQSPEQAAAERMKRNDEVESFVIASRGAGIEPTLPRFHEHLRQKVRAVRKTC